MLPPRFSQRALRESPQLTDTLQCFSCKQQGRSSSVLILTECLAELWATCGPLTNFGYLSFGVPKLCLTFEGWVAHVTPVTVCERSGALHSAHRCLKVGVPNILDLKLGSLPIM